jgi:hypothetical protein
VAESLPTLFTSPASSAATEFSLAPFLFGEALAAGWPLELALHFFTSLLRCRSCAGGLGLFRSEESAPPPPPRPTARGGELARWPHHLRH